MDLPRDQDGIINGYLVKQIALLENFSEWKDQSKIEKELFLVI